ncbi:MAG: ferredoxin family protein [Planctomyces sp.]|nr:ferredoxin family protein [Planctomyces sp.]
MAAGKLTVVISQAPGKNPVKRALEEEIAVQLMLGGKVDVSVIPNLYDLPADHTGLMFLRSLSGPVVVLSWLFPRAAHWVLDRQQIPGRVGKTLLVETDEDSEDEEGESDTSNAAVLAEMAEASHDPALASSTNGRPKRTIWSIDLRVRAEAQPFIDEVHRIADELAMPVVSLGLSLGKFPTKNPSGTAGSPPVVPLPGTNGSASNGHATNGHAGNGHVDHVQAKHEDAATTPLSGNPLDILRLGTEEPAKRRWYPVIDYSRCTNCMECIDFCLFGVYGVDALDKILVEQQDSCKKGCPACSRVCPANAIIFPEHKTPAIAGAEGDGPTAFKVDLSKLFGGGNDSAETALEMAVKERDQELVADGRGAVGMSVGIPKRQEGKAESPRDNLDDLLDSLDNF